MTDDPLPELHAHVLRVVKARQATLERLAEEAFMAQCETGHPAVLVFVYGAGHAPGIACEINR